jgi:hypothetical protein
MRLITSFFSPGLFRILIGLNVRAMKEYMKNKIAFYDEIS